MLKSEHCFFLESWRAARSHRSTCNSALLKFCGVLVVVTSFSPHGLAPCVGTCYYGTVAVLTYCIYVDSVENPPFSKHTRLCVRQDPFLSWLGFLTITSSRTWGAV